MGSIGHRSCEKIMKEKTPLSSGFVCFQVGIIEWEITSFSKSPLLQSEPFLTMCYTINNSPLLVPSKFLFVLSNYQSTCTFPVRLAQFYKSLIVLKLCPYLFLSFWIWSCENNSNAVNIRSFKSCGLGGFSTQIQAPIRRKWFAGNNYKRVYLYHPFW